MQTAQSRLNEIEGWLLAYRLGWVGWDAEHVQELKDERFQLVVSVPLMRELSTVVGE